MSLDYAKFRVLFPQFEDPLKYPDAVLDIFYEVAQSFIDSADSPCRVLTGAQLGLALMYMTAHLLYLQTEAQKAVESGGGDVDQGGFVTSATIGDVSVTKMAPPASDGWEYWLSSTPYGAALWALLQLLAVGGLAIGGLPEREGFRKIGGVFW